VPERHRRARAEQPHQRAPEAEQAPDHARVHYPVAAKPGNRSVAYVSVPAVLCTRV
jgi:hypothetical protein